MDNYDSPKYVSFETYWNDYADQCFEWVDGELIRLTPIEERHDTIAFYLRSLFNAYFAIQKMGFARSMPFFMYFEESRRYREPDVQVILNSNPHYTATGVRGPADIAIEVVSRESVARDHGTKLNEYERHHVPEYWIIDPLRTEARIYVLQEGLYKPADISTGTYESPLLPDFKLDVGLIWNDPLPDIVECVEMVQQMLGER